MTTAGIYIIANTKSGKAYVGSTVNFEQRWYSHKSLLRRDTHDNPHLQAAWNLYGEAAFEFGILEYLDDSEKLHLAEQLWMDVYREEGKELYNFGLAARHPMLGRKHTEEARRKISEAGKGKHPSEETRRRLRGAQKGRAVSKETCRRMSEGRRGMKFSEEHRRNLSKALKGNRRALGYKHSEGTRRKVSEAGGRPYPAFIHRETGEVIPAGVNLCAVCQMRGLHSGCMCRVKAGKQSHHKGWMLMIDTGEQE